jgi:hypothetical protein
MVLDELAELSRHLNKRTLRVSSPRPEESSSPSIAMRLEGDMQMPSLSDSALADVIASSGQTDAKTQMRYLVSSVPAFSMGFFYRPNPFPCPEPDLCPRTENPSTDFTKRDSLRESPPDGLDWMSIGDLLKENWSSLPDDQEKEKPASSTTSSSTSP